jgi:hypothetical protein
VYAGKRAAERLEANGTLMENFPISWFSRRRELAIGRPQRR